MIRAACIICVTLTHWGRVTDICVSILTITGSDNGLSPGRRETIIWTDDGIALIGALGSKLQWNLNRNLYSFIQENEFVNVIWKLAVTFFRPQYVNNFIRVTKSNFSIPLIRRFCRIIKTLHRVYVWHGRSTHLGCDDSSQTWTWSRESNKHFCKFGKVPNGWINELSLSNPDPYNSFQR